MVTFRVYPTPSEGPSEGPSNGPTSDSHGFSGDATAAAFASRARRPAYEPGRAAQGGPASAGNVIAALASFFMPGLGQLIQGRLMSAAFLCLATTVGYFLWFLVLPALFAFVLHVIAVLDAALYTSRREPLFSAQFSS